MSTSDLIRVMQRFVASSPDELEFRIPRDEMLGFIDELLKMQSRITAVQSQAAMPLALVDKQQAVTDEITKRIKPGALLYLVWGDHGDYSSRIEYAVCWYTSPEEAAARVAELVALDSVWSLRCANADRFGEVHKQALSALGDPQWSPNTSYSVVEIPRGGVVAS